MFLISGLPNQYIYICKVSVSFLFLLCIHLCCEFIISSHSHVEGEGNSEFVLGIIYIWTQNSFI